MLLPLELLISQAETVVPTYGFTGPFHHLGSVETGREAESKSFFLG